jgi:hypothetical protein
MTGRAHLADDGETRVVWEFVPDRRNLPPVLRSIIRQPTQRVLTDGNSIAFDGPFVHDAYPNRDLKGRQLFKQRPPKQRAEPIPMNDIVQAFAYPVIGGFEAAATHTRSRYVVVDLLRRDDARTVARIERSLGIEPADEAALAAAVRSLIGSRWSDTPTDIFAGILDEERLAAWWSPEG